MSNPYAFHTTLARCNETYVSTSNRVKCTGTGYFFVYITGPDVGFPAYRLITINKNRIKAGAFQNVHHEEVPIFIENRNFNNLPQGARGCAIMHHPLPMEEMGTGKRRKLDSTVSPSDQYCLGWISKIDGYRQCIKVYSLNMVPSNETFLLLQEDPQNFF